MLALSLVFYAFAAALLLFGALVVARFALGLAKDARALAQRTRQAGTKLTEALEDVSAESGRAARAIAALEDKRARPRRKGSGPGRRID